MKRVICLILIGLMLLGIACTAVTVEYPKSAAVEPIELGFDVPEITDYDGFSYTLSSALIDGTKNSNLSPLSIYCALAMVAEGANGKTQTDLLHFLGCESTDTMRESVSRMLERQTAETETGSLSLCNSLWMSKAFPFRKEYQTLLKDFYSADTETVSFGTDAAGRRISAWINKNTNGRITPDPESMQFDPITVAVLFNTIYLKDQWYVPFSEDAIQSGLFTCSDGTTKVVDYLHRFSEERVVYRSEGFMRYSVSLQSKGTVTFVLPDENTALSDLLGTPEKMETLLTGGESVAADVDLLLPKFAFSDEYELTDMMCALGLRGAFSDGADFSKMTRVPTRLDRVIQKTVIDVNETGVEAAAYTAVIDAPGDAYSEPVTLPKIEFHLNRPFLFCIEGKWNTLLFIGTVTEPSPSQIAD